MRTRQMVQIARALTDPRDRDSAISERGLTGSLSERLLQPGDPTKGNVLMQPVQLFHLLAPQKPFQPKEYRLSEG
jgi:hypothetical protein